MREISRRYRSVVHPEVHFSPAKLNLYLAVTGRRADGFHDLVSLAVPLVWGDELRVTPTDGAFTLTCNDPAVPVDDTNLVLRAAHSFRTATGWTGGARFVLEKRIPMGAGLGGLRKEAEGLFQDLSRQEALLQELETGASEREERIEFLEFQIREIEEIGPSPGEKIGRAHV